MTNMRGGTVGGAVGGGLAAVAILVAGCGASSSASQQPARAASPPAHSAGQQPQSAAGTVTTQVSPAALRRLAVRYLAIARPANRRLDAENDGYGDAEQEDLAAARADLRGEAATEHRFDAQLLEIRFPPWIALTARALVRQNQLRITLTQDQARSASLAALRSFDRRHAAADAAVETQVRLIRVFLGLPPPSTS
jgi:hypothetical protein